MSMPISVCNDTFKINNVVFLPTKDSERFLDGFPIFKKNKARIYKGSK